jgi:hypothetical protein
MRTVVPSLIGAANDSVVIRFLRKKDIFLFQLPVGYGSGVEKPKSLKYFEVRSVRGKEPCFDKKNYYKNDRRGHWART